MKKLQYVSVVLSAIILALVLFIIGRITAPESDSEPENGSNDEAIAALHSVLPESENIEDETLVDLAEEVCDEFDSGASFDDVAATGLSEGNSPKFVGGVIAWSVVYFCPEHDDKV